MRSTFSAVDVSTRMEIKDLLSRFCHALDHNRPGDWIDLFRSDAVVVAPRFGTFRGREEVMQIPGLVAEEGGGAWRHIFNNIVIDACEDRKKYVVRAYCIVNDWRSRGVAIRSWDFAANVVRARYLQISDLELRPVGDFCKNPRSHNHGLLREAQPMEQRADC